MAVCPECDGSGVVEVLTAAQCTRRIGECCGGCTADVDCKRCGGSGEVPEEEEGDERTAA